MVDGAAASVTRGVVHHTVCPTHRVIQLSHAVAASVTVHSELLLQRGAEGGLGRHGEYNKNIIG